MSDDHKKHDPDQEEDRGYTPASPVKRTMAWIGLVYVLMLLGLTTYIYYTGTALGNMGPMLALPGLIGLGILALVSHKTTGSPSRMATIAAVLACWALAAFTLPLAVVGFMSNFGG